MYADKVLTHERTDVIESLILLYIRYWYGLDQYLVAHTYNLQSKIKSYLSPTDQLVEQQRLRQLFRGPLIYDVDGSRGLH